MTVWNDAVLTAIYTLTPLHFGIGQAASAVDLPIAREAGTGFPLLPATGLKGVAKDFCGRNGDGEKMHKDDIKALFGPEIDDAENDGELNAGALTFTEARLAAYPVRSLNRPFLHVTCPLILERLARDLRAANVRTDLVPRELAVALAPGKALVSGRSLSGSALVLEDLVYEEGFVEQSEPLAGLAEALAALLPDEEIGTRKRLTDALVMIPDADFADLMGRVVPVRARIKLTDGKTTDRWENPNDPSDVQTGNLWYEEHLPPDCLFLALVAERRQRSRGQGAEAGSGNGSTAPPLKTLLEHKDRLRVVQIGGNETVGYGLCWWSGWSGSKRS